MFDNILWPVLLHGLLLPSVLARHQAKFQRVEEQRKQLGDKPTESERGNAWENLEARYEISENDDEDNDDVDTYFHNGLDSYLHAITRPNKLLRISENGDITYSIR